MASPIIPKTSPPMSKMTRTIDISPTVKTNLSSGFSKLALIKKNSNKQGISQIDKEPVNLIALTSYSHHYYCIIIKNFKQICNYF